MAAKYQREELDFEFQSDTAQTMKIIGFGFASLIAVAVFASGTLYMINRPAHDTSGMPSAAGLAIALSSKGRMSARDWDNTMGELCSQMAALPGMMSDSEETSGQLQRRKADQARCKNGR